MPDAPTAGLQPALGTTIRHPMATESVEKRPGTPASTPRLTDTAPPGPGVPHVPGGTPILRAVDSRPAAQGPAGAGGEAPPAGPPDTTRWLTVPQAATRLDRSNSAVYGLIRRGTLHAGWDRRWLIREDVLTAYQRDRMTLLSAKRSAAARRANHNRHHVTRGTRTPGCELCR